MKEAERKLYEKGYYLSKYLPFFFGGFLVPHFAITSPHLPPGIPS